MAAPPGRPYSDSSDCSTGRQNSRCQSRVAKREIARISRSTPQRKLISKQPSRSRAKELANPTTIESVSGWSCVVAFVPSIVPLDDTVYIVEDDFGPIGRAYRETEVDRADRASALNDLYSGEFNDPVRVVAFNTREGWARDVSREFALELQLRAELEDRQLRGKLAAFVEAYTKAERSYRGLFDLGRPYGSAMRDRPQSPHLLAKIRPAGRPPKRYLARRPAAILAKTRPATSKGRHRRRIIHLER
jgi:hypothetical protein